MHLSSFSFYIFARYEYIQKKYRVCEYVSVWLLLLTCFSKIIVCLSLLSIWNNVSHFTWQIVVHSTYIWYFRNAFPYWGTFSLFPISCWPTVNHSPPLIQNVDASLPLELPVLLHLFNELKHSVMMFHNNSILLIRKQASEKLNNFQRSSRWYLWSQNLYTGLGHSGNSVLTNGLYTLYLIHRIEFIKKTYFLNT